MLMVVFGAGASFDSIDLALSTESRTGATSWQPPLASQLFEDRGTFNAFIDEYPRSRAAVYRLRSKLASQSGVLVEEELGLIEQEGESNPDRLVELAALRFYLRGAITACSNRWASTSNGMTNYLALINLLRHWQHSSHEELVLVTFNYDTLLEQACASEMNHVITTMGDYLKRPELSIIKVHGSIDWVHPISPSTLPIGTEADLVTYAARLPIRSAEFNFEAPGARLVRPGRINFPAIAIPVLRKTDFECPAHLLDHLDLACPKVSRLLVIGWAGADRHFLDRARANGLEPDHTLVVSGSVRHSRATAAALAAAGLNRDVAQFHGGFSDIVSPHESSLQAFLDRAVPPR